MAVDVTTLQPGQALVLLKKFKEYEAGTVVNYEKSIAVQGAPVPMVAVPGGRPFGVPAVDLDLSGGAAAVEAPAAEEQAVDGPVLDFFMSHANMEQAMSVNFFGAYLNVFGGDDLSFLEELMANHGLPVGQAWTSKQTATLADDFYNAFGGEDPLVQATLAAPEPVATPAPKPAAVAKPAATPKPAAAAVEKPAAAPKTAPAVAKTDKAFWDAEHMGALKLVGALAGLYADAPDTFDAELALAVKMLKATDKIK